MNAPATNTRLFIGPHQLPGELTLTGAHQPVVLFAHGSGSSRNSPRNLQVAGSLQRHGLGTLLFDLLTPQEAQDRRNVFDIELLGNRLLQAVDELDRNPLHRKRALGLFGASTGAAAALVAAARRPQRVHAVVSRGGRPDLAARWLAEVRAPTLLIVGGDDTEVLALNREAHEQLGCSVRQLVVVPGATHLFEEPGTLDEVARLAAGWFGRHLAGGS